MREKARQAWETFRKRISDAALLFQPASPLSQDPTVLNFMNGQNVARSTDEQAQSDLEQALSLPSGVYQADIFQHPQLSETGLALFIDGRINREQISTFLQIEEAKTLAREKDLDDVIFYPIFDSPECTRFSKEALWYLLPFLTYRNKHLNALSEEQLLYFKALMAEAPPSERYFYVFPEPPDKENELRNVLARFDAILIHESEAGNKIVGLSFSAKNARLIARCGINNMVAHVATLGRKSVNKMLLGEKHDIRYADLYFPGAPTHKTVHNYPPEYFSEFYNTDHDYDHANTGSVTPRHFRHAMLRMAEITGAFCHRQGFEGCIARWDLTDKEFTYFRYMRAFNEKSHYNEAVFCDFLDHGSGGKFLRLNSAHLFIPNRLTPLHHVHETYTHLGIIIMLDMCAHPDEWKNIDKVNKKGINPHALTGDYKTLYEKVKRVYPLIKNDPDYLQVFKVQQSYTLKTYQECLGMCTLIDALTDPITATVLAPTNASLTAPVKSTATASFKSTFRPNTITSFPNFSFSRRLDNLHSQEFLQLIKTDYGKTLKDERLRKQFEDTVDCILLNDQLYTGEKSSHSQSYFAFFRNALSGGNPFYNLRQNLREIMTLFSGVKEATYQAVLMLGIGKTALWQDYPSNQMPLLPASLCRTDIKPDEEIIEEKSLNLT